MKTFSSRLALALALMTATPFAAKAQLIDPNNRCVYQPGSRTCEPIRTPTAPQSNEPPFQAFVGIATRSNIDLSAHPTYTSDYVDERARLYCSLLGQGESMKVVREVTFPPVVHMTETQRNRDRLEVAILRVGAASICPSFWAQEQQIEATIVR